MSSDLRPRAIQVHNTRISRVSLLTNNTSCFGVVDKHENAFWINSNYTIHSTLHWRSNECCNLNCAQKSQLFCNNENFHWCTIDLANPLRTGYLKKNVFITQATISSHSEERKLHQKWIWFRVLKSNVTHYFLVVIESWSYRRKIWTDYCNNRKLIVNLALDLAVVIQFKIPN